MRPAQAEPPADAQAVLTVDLGAVVANWRALCARHPHGAVAAVVKANAYGLGAEHIVTALYAAGCQHFFVALLREAIAIRPYAPGALIGVLNGLLPGSEAEYVAHDLVPVVGTLAELEAWREAARHVGRKLPVILHIDTGMSRLGLDSSALLSVQQDHARLAGLDLRYLLTHLVSSELADDPLNQLQRARFDAACAGLPTARRSFANSSGIFLGAAAGSDLARPGAALYGINPLPGRPNPMRLAVGLQVRVLAVRDVPAGTSVGYNATWHASRMSRIATAAIGYADGWHRSLSGRGKAYFDGTPVPLVGRVSMDLTTFDVTDCPGVRAGAWLELIGPHQSPDDVAEQAATNGYEVLTSLSSRFHRVYLPA